MAVQIYKDGKTYSAASLRSLHKVAFSGDVPPRSLVEALGYQLVTPDPKPETAGKIVQAGLVVERGGKPYQTWTEREPTAKELDQDVRRAKGLNAPQFASSLLMVDLWLFMTTGKTPDEATEEEFSAAEQAVENRLRHHARTACSRLNSPRQGGASGS
ncbi:MAG: hypothetical protein R6V30_08860 [Paracoccaceae bacterium]